MDKIHEWYHFGQDPCNNCEFEISAHPYFLALIRKKGIHPIRNKDKRVAESSLASGYMQQ